MPYKTMHYASAARPVQIKPGSLLKTCNTMKKKLSKKLQLDKVKIASLSKSKQEALNANSIKIACISQGAPICSEDSCIF